MESKSKLKQLTHFFLPSKLLHNSSNSTSSSTIFTSSSSPNTGSTRSDDPLFLTSNVKVYKLDQSLLSNSSSSSKKLSFDLTKMCKPNKHSQNKDVVSNASNKIERRVRESGEFYDTGTRCKERQICPPSSRFDGLYIHENVEDKKEKIDIGKKVGYRNSYGFSSSSENDESGVFSRDEVIDDENETEAFLSSRSFYSSASCEFYTRPTKNKNKIKNKRKISQTSRRRRRVGHGKREKKVVRGIPVVKRSDDPYVDFRDSMLEMIIERQVFGDKDMKKLVSSYLSLNSPLHHDVILRAFADISNVLFGH